MRAAILPGALALGLVAATLPVQAALACLADGEPIHWVVDYCMMKMETDDEIAVSGCLEEQQKQRFKDACASNLHFKALMCRQAIANGTRKGTLEQCVGDPGFKGRTVERGGVGG